MGLAKKEVKNEAKNDKEAKEAKNEEVLLISSTTAAGLPRATANGDIVDKKTEIVQIESDINEAEEVAELLLEAERKLFESSELGEDEINEESRHMKFKLL